MKRLLIVATLLLTACTVPSVAKPQPSKQTPHCVAVVANSLTKGDPVGLWGCLSADAQAQYFYQNGWHDDASVASTLDASKGATLDVLLFAGNPVNGNVWLLYAAPDNGSGQPDLNQGTGLKIALDSSGKISKIE